MAAALVENLQREDLNPIDEGEGYRRLMEEFSLTQERVADSVGKSRSHIANTVRLLKLPATVQAELRRGTLSAGHARALLTHPDPVRARPGRHRARSQCPPDRGVGQSAGRGRRTEAP